MSEPLQEVIDYWEKNPVSSIEFNPNFEDNLTNYCDFIDNLRWSDNERWAKEFYEFDLSEGSLILDAGCGIGVCSRYYARKGYKVHAIDITPKAVELTKRSFELFGLEGKITRGNVEKIDYPDNYFDCLVSNGVIHHTLNTEKAVDEFFRVLKPGGVAHCSIYYRNILFKPGLWWLVKLLLPLLLNRKKGREKMLEVHTPEDMVKVYDGNHTPIAKLYSRQESDHLFRKFRVKLVEPHFFPARFLYGLKVGGLLHKLLDKYCGTMVYYLLEKPNEPDNC